MSQSCNNIIMILLSPTPTVRLSDSAEPAGTDHTGKIVSFAAIGSGAGAVKISPRPWVCLTDDISNVEWQFPNGSLVGARIRITDTYLASGTNLFSRNVGPHCVVLYRGPDYNSPDGEYCCVRTTTNDRKCVTFSKYNFNRFNRLKKFIIMQLPVPH